jgi:hypothetical protein
MTTYLRATEQDDADLRALLRDNAMPSWVTMSVMREPSFFAGADHFGRDWAVIARQEGIPVGMYTCSEQRVHLNGMPAELGYIGALRVSPSYRNRLRILRDGYTSIRKLSSPGLQQLWYTAVASENRVARRLLEANIDGMPCYWATNELVTLALSKARGKHHALWEPVRVDAELQALCSFYNDQAARFQFSPVLTPTIAARTGASFYAIKQEGEIKACMALWNQQHYKQIVARAYRPPLDRLRPIYNVYARLVRSVSLPPPNAALDMASLAFLMIAPPLDRQIESLIEDALAINTTAVLTLGLHEQHPWLSALKRAFRPQAYTTCIYAVNFESSITLDGRPAQPEVAVL